MVQHYIQSDHLKLLAPYTTHRCTTTTPSLVQLENLIGGSHQTTEEVGLTTSKYFCSLELCVKLKVEINGVTILCVELHVHSTCVWLSFTCDSGVLPKYWLLVIMGARQATCSRVISYNSGRVHINIQSNWW